MTTKLQGSVIPCDEIGSGAIVRITVGKYKGTLTGVEARKYSGWSGNVEMRDGTDPDGNTVTVYMLDGASDDARFSRD